MHRNSPHEENCPDWTRKDAEWALTNQYNDWFQYVLKPSCDIKEESRRNRAAAFVKKFDNSRWFRFRVTLSVKLMPKVFYDYMRDLISL